jgi:glutamyl aminopeptidase
VKSFRFYFSGAMETWGLVTYRETNLLYDEAVSSTGNKQRIAAVIAHEFAHMWFGNLVTMKWWSDLWLNEGFASYIEFKGIAAAWPSWNMEEQFTVDTMHSILNLDATLGSHPIVVGVETPDQITEIFDGITYNKGASIIRMIEDFIGPDKFQEGVSAYLDANKFMNADSNDLVKHLEGKIEEDVGAIVNTWIRQKGLPVVTVERDGNNFKLTQKRFLTDPEAEGKETVTSEYNYKWSIPITFVTSTNPEEVQRQWFHFNMNEIVIPVAGNIDWIKFNKDQIGYYRVKYDVSMWQSLNKALEQNISTMSVLDRAHLLNDVFSLAEGLQVPYDTALTMTKYLKSETSFVPWDVASSKLKGIRNLLYYTEFYPKFKEYVVELVDEAYKSITWEVDPNAHLEK